MFPEGGWEKKGKKQKKEPPKHLSSSPLYTKSPVKNAESSVGSYTP